MIPDPSPEQLQWVLDHNMQIRGGHRYQIALAVEAWREDRKKLEGVMAKAKAVAVPVKEKPKGKYEKVEMPKADTLGISFVEVADELAAIVAERKRLDEQIKERYTLLRAYMEDEDDSKSWGVRGEGYVVSYVKPKPKSTLVKELLIQQGVTMKQIKKATKETPVTPYVTMRLAGEEE